MQEWVTLNRWEAARWYEKAAAQGQPNARFCLAHMLLNGQYLPEDKARAHELFAMACRQGLQEACAEEVKLKTE